jgi:adenosyl cobinamide kinase/adenosyl cobinamide phosphate guanylyltransferase
MTKEFNNTNLFVLLNCLYKWVTKVMTIRVEPVAHKVILKTQLAFIKGGI